MVTVSEDNISAARYDPIRTIGPAFSMPAQNQPDNLHGIFIGAERTGLRDLAFAMRMHAGPVLVLADERLLPPPGSALSDLDLSQLRLPNLTRFPGYRALCEAAAGEQADLVKEAWDLTTEQEVPPGTYRRITLISQQGGSVPGLMRLCGHLGLPDPQLQGNQISCLVPSLEALRRLAEFRWVPVGQPEPDLSRAYAAAETVVIAATDISLGLALEQVDHIQGPIVHRRIVAFLSGGMAWTPFVAPVQVLVTQGGDVRLPAFLELAFASIQQAHIAGDGRLKTIIIDHELLSEQTADIAETIARTGRKHHCSTLVISDQTPSGIWSSVAGFTVRKTTVGYELAIDQHHTQPFDIAGDSKVSEAHAILHRSNG